MEAIGIVGAIAAVTQLSAYTSRSIDFFSEFRSSLKDAPQKIQHLIVEVQALQEILTKVQPQGGPQQTLIDHCAVRTTMLLNLLQTLQTSSSGRLRRAFHFQHSDARSHNYWRSLKE